MGTRRTAPPLFEGMRAHVRLGSLAGIPIGLNWSVLFVAGLLTFNLATGLLPASGWALGVLFAALLAVVFYGCLLAHELAHSVVARRNGVPVDGITLWLLGGVARLGGDIPSAGAQFRIAIAGPLTSLGLSAGFAVLAAATSAVGGAGLVVAGLEWLAAVNLVLAVFNMIPAAPLDGGRVLAALLWWHHGDRERAIIGAAQVGKLAGTGFIAFGLVSVLAGWSFGGLWPALLGWFVVSAASAEERYARRARALRLAPPRDDPFGDLQWWRQRV